MTSLKNVWGCFLFAVLSFLSFQVSASNYSYDANSQLQSATQSSGTTAVYHYDNMGNIINVSQENIPTPHIDSFAPNYGSVGETVALIGTNFATTTSANTVSFNGTGAAVLTATSTQLTVQVPTGASSGPITVTTTGGSDTTVTDFNVITYGLPPTISTVSVSGGEIGDSVVINGDNLNPITGQTTVLLSGFPVTPTYISNTEIDFEVPPYGGVFLISVETPFGIANSNYVMGTYPSGYTDTNVENNSSLPIPTGSTASSTATITMPDSGSTAAIYIESVSGQWKTLNLNFGTNIPYSLSYEIEDNYGNIISGSSISPSTANYSLHLPYLPNANTSYMVLLTSYSSSNNWTASVSEDPEMSVNSSLTLAINDNTNTTNRFILDSVTNHNYGLGVVEDSTGTTNGLGFQVSSPNTGGLLSYYSGGSSEANNSSQTTISGNGQIPLIANLTSSGSGDTANITLYFYEDKSYSLTTGTSTAISNDHIGQNMDLNFSVNGGYAYTVAFDTLTSSDTLGNSLNYLSLSNSYLFNTTRTVSDLMQVTHLDTTPNYTMSQNYNGVNTTTYAPSFPIPLSSTTQNLQMVLAPEYAFGFTANATLIAQSIPTITPNSSSTTLTASAQGQYLYEYISLNSGDNATLAFYNYSLPDTSYHNFTVYITDPTGNPVSVSGTTCDTTTTGCTFNITDAPSTGNYIVQIIPQDNEVWTMDSQLSYSDNIVAVSGISESFSATFNGQDVFVQIPVTAFTPVTITSDITANSGSGSDVTIYYKIIDPTGDITYSAPLIYNSEQISGTGSVVVNLDLPTMTGTYLVHIYNTQGATFSGDIELQNGVVDNLTVGTGATMSSTVKGQDNNLFFPAVMGTSYTVNISSLTLPIDNIGGAVPMYVYDSNGSVINGTYCSPSSCSISVGAASMTGNYQIIFDNSLYNSTASATVEVDTP